MAELVWASHEMGERVVVWNKPRGRPKLRWLEKIKAYSKELLVERSMKCARQHNAMLDPGGIQASSKKCNWPQADHTVMPDKILVMLQVFKKKVNNTCRRLGFDSGS